MVLLDILTLVPSYSALCYEMTYSLQQLLIFSVLYIFAS